MSGVPEIGTEGMRLRSSPCHILNSRTFPTVKGAHIARASLAFVRATGTGMRSSSMRATFATVAAISAIAKTPTDHASYGEESPDDYQCSDDQCRWGYAYLLQHVSPIKSSWLRLGPGFKPRICPSKPNQGLQDHLSGFSSRYRA